MFEDFRLKVFVTLAAEKSFTKAAASLHISQPAVSQHVSELEKQLDARLFERLRGETVLTPAGRVFLSHARRILSDYAQVETLFSPVRETVVKVSACEQVYDYLMNGPFADFVAVHPQVTFMSAFPDEADLTVRLLPDEKERGTFALGFSPSESFAATPLYEMLTQLL